MQANLGPLVAYEPDTLVVDVNELAISRTRTERITAVLATYPALVISFQTRQRIPVIK